VSPDDFSFSFEIEFDQVPAQDKKKNEKKEKDNNIQGKKENSGNYGRREFLVFLDKKNNDKEKDDKEDNSRSDNSGTLFL